MVFDFYFDGVTVKTGNTKKPVDKVHPCKGHLHNRYKWCGLIEKWDGTHNFCKEIPMLFWVHRHWPCSLNLVFEL